MDHFTLTLKNEKLKQYHRIAFFIILINLALFVYIALSATAQQIRIAAIGGIVIVVIALAIDRFLISIKNNEDTPYIHLALYLITMAWWKIGFWWAGVLCLLLATLFIIAKRVLLVNIRKDKISYPSFPGKTIHWTELNNIILKDSLLTIDLKNNKFIQQPVDESKTRVNEQEFNDFCQQQLNP